MKEQKNINHNYFNEISENQARILGLIASDGSLKINQIKYTSIDYELPKYIYDNIGGTISETTQNDAPLYIWRGSSRVISEYLNRIGITAKKSRTLQIDFSIFNTHKILYSFLIGVLDGDGCVTYTEKENKITNHRIILTSASKMFVDQIMKYYPEFTNITVMSRKNGDIFNITCNRRKELKSLINKICKLCNRSGILNRKYSKMLDIRKSLEE